MEPNKIMVFSIILNQSRI